jgi:hypothetical protein
MRIYLSNRASLFLGLLILLSFCWLSTDWIKAEGATAGGDPPAETKFSCTIAKSAYGSPSFDEPVRRLHRFRDQVLMGSGLGRWVTKAYYRLSGSFAPLLDSGGLAGRSLKRAIRGFLYLVKYLEAVGLGTGVFLIAFVFGRRKASALKASPFSPRGSQPGF